MVMKEINSVIKDLEMLKSGEWEPDEDSCNASIEMLERAKEEFNKMYSEDDLKKALNIGFTSTDETWEQCLEFCKEQLFKNK